MEGQQQGGAQQQQQQLTVELAAERAASAALRGQLAVEREEQRQLLVLVQRLVGQLGPQQTELMHTRAELERLLDAVDADEQQKELEALEAAASGTVPPPLQQQPAQLVLRAGANGGSAMLAAVDRATQTVVSGAAAAAGGTPQRPSPECGGLSAVVAADGGAGVGKLQLLEELSAACRRCELAAAARRGGNGRPLEVQAGGGRGRGALDNHVDRGSRGGSDSGDRLGGSTGDGSLLSTADDHLSMTSSPYREYYPGDPAMTMEARLQ
jgi:hypothetical protein